MAFESIPGSSHHSMPSSEGSDGFSSQSPIFTQEERAVLLALSEAIFPPTGPFQCSPETIVTRFERYCQGTPRIFRDNYRRFIQAVDLAPLPIKGKRLSKLAREPRTRLLEQWIDVNNYAIRHLLLGTIIPIKQAYFSEESLYSSIGCNRGVHLPIADEQPRWAAQVIDGATETNTDSPLELEAEVIVIGTGAGGAAVAYELAQRGRAVLMLEDGKFFRRSDFNGRSADMMKLLYRDMGLTIAVGNNSFPIFAGRTVGGSTTVNSGTCYRAPKRVFDRWQRELGLSMLNEETMDPYYSRVESMLGVAQAERAYLGNVAKVIERGCNAIGFEHHGPLHRNAPGCDGQGLCCFGCPTGAKRSADVSWVPEALSRGAQLVTGAKATDFDVVGGRVRAVRGHLSGGRSFVARAPAIIIAAGTLHTPLLAKKAGVGKHCSMLGRNLSIHPATKVMAQFDETIDQWSGIPQSYTIEEWKDEGIMFEGASTPLEVFSVGIPWVGKKYMDLMTQYRNVATFGFMIEDTSRGRIFENIDGRPLITYFLSQHDVKRVQKGIAKLSEVYFAAGAKRVFPFVHGHHVFESRSDIDKFMSASLSAGDLELTAYHPLGTCRIGTDPKTSVLGPDHQSHEIAGLYVVDGASVPTSLGVNPQMTIMALALRAGELIDRSLG